MSKLIPKHLTPANPLVLQNDNTRVSQPVLSVPTTNSIDLVGAANNKIDQMIQSQPYSEIVRYPKRPKSEKEAITIISDPRKAPLTSSERVIGMSGTDPIGEFIVGNAVLGKPLQWLGKGLLYGAAKAGNNWAKAKIISSNMKVSPDKFNKGYYIKGHNLNLDSKKKFYVPTTKTTPEAVMFEPRLTLKEAVNLTDNQWDNLFEQAFKNKDSNQMKLLRLLHFQVKSGNDPQVFAHYSPNKFHIFDKSKFGTTTDDGYHGIGFYFGETQMPGEFARLLHLKANRPFGPNGEIPTYRYSGKPQYFYLKGDRLYNVGNPERNYFSEPNTVGFLRRENEKLASEVIVGQPTQIKSARTITFDDDGNLIRLSKRDNFNNPDFRYKNGGKLIKHKI